MRRPINGDGFGVGYYTEDLDLGEGPCIFTAITPAWNNANLARLAEKTKSSLVFAHVRASTTGALAENNCHPFSYHSLMWMHNGHISSFGKMKRKLINRISDRYFLHVQGGTDSEWAFALFLNTLEELGAEPSSTGPDFEGFGHKILRQAVLGTIALLNQWSSEVGIEEPSLLNFAVTDGHSVVCTRYIQSRTEAAASLYFSSGTSFHEYQSGGFYRMERHDRGQDVIMIASEPLTFERGDWITVPNNSCITVSKDQALLLHPIIDRFYESDPSYERSNIFAESKGQVDGGVALTDHERISNAVA